MTIVNVYDIVTLEFQNVNIEILMYICCFWIFFNWKRNYFGGATMWFTSNGFTIRKLANELLCLQDT